VLRGTIACDTIATAFNKALFIGQNLYCCVFVLKLKQDSKLVTKHWIF